MQSRKDANNSISTSLRAFDFAR